ncbi:hypothetical protein CC78DRAFT_615447 [Lojkania enalia]|uniref:Rhodopsin domain-containing protein n=1 Tax=Lojkania enalia TaxID=147567 RepID=A0A9P4N4L6_9PLEO|nr:hypothetical protein CC78DRAFT_615447 [Didymosphaeria enalia]
MDLDVPGHGERTARGVAVLVTLYFWTVVTCSVLLVRFVRTWRQGRAFGSEDLMAFASIVVYVTATVSWNFCVSTGGLGRRYVEVSPGAASTFMKTVWASQLLQLTAMGFAKTSTAFLLDRVAPQSRRKTAFLFGMVAFWAIYSIFAFGLQCGFPKPWHNVPTCAYGGPVFSVIVLDMVSDAILAWWIFPIIRKMELKNGERRVFAIVFGSRALIPIISIAQIWAVANAVRGNDPTRDCVPIAIIHQTITSLSVIIASIPHVKRFPALVKLLNPHTGGTEIILSDRPRSKRLSKDGIPLKLVPSNTPKFTTTIRSGGHQSQKKVKGRAKSDWDTLVSKQDDHASTSSLFEHQGGVILQQEVTVRVEKNEEVLSD